MPISQSAADGCLRMILPVYLPVTSTRLERLEIIGIGELLAVLVAFDEALERDISRLPPSFRHSRR